MRKVQPAVGELVGFIGIRYRSKTLPALANRANSIEKICEFGPSFSGTPSRLKQDDKVRNAGSMCWANRHRHDCCCVVGMRSVGRIVRDVVMPTF